MPDVTVVSPAAVVPADRLTLGSCDARLDLTVGESAYHPCWFPLCMAEE